jgi:light-regulated signal transduction histidine kinase (bacteriophytochrome)
MKMMTNQHRIPINLEKSLVARAAREKTAVLSTNVTIDPNWLPNAALPATKTELAVPIKLGDQVLGVLDIQHDEIGSLTAEDELLMMGLCGQIAVAINNRQLEEKRQLAERALKAYTVELERSNRELQDFAYVASHDLQEPLRKIRAFSDRLASSYGSELGDRGADYIDRMQKASARMQTLIDDLLTFSRVTTKARPFTTVDLMEVAEGVVSDLEIRLEQTNGRVVLKSLPTIEADRIQMRQLFQNLLSNGLKFHQHDVAPIVTVTGELFTNDDKEERCRLTITDNGIGFDEKYNDRIFGIFQRLHGRSAYEGTGIGLAICRKIAERHQGSIVAHSKEGEGATFVIQLPQKQAETESYAE